MIHCGLCISERDVRKAKQQSCLSLPPTIPERHSWLCYNSFFLAVTPCCALSWVLNPTANQWNMLNYPGEKCSYRHQRSRILPSVLFLSLWKIFIKFPCLVSFLCKDLRFLFDPLQFHWTSKVESIIPLVCFSFFDYTSVFVREGQHNTAQTFALKLW